MIRVVGDLGRRENGPERGLCSNHLLVRPRTLRYVRLKEELATRREQPCYLLDEPLGDQEPLLVTLLPPGIGKVDVDGGERPAHEPRKRQARVLREHSRAIAEALLPQAGVNERRPFETSLEPEHPEIAFRCEALVQEAPVPRADLDLYGSVAQVEKRSGVDRRAVRQARRIRVGTIHGARGR